MGLLLPHQCQICGLEDEAKLVYAGPHVKQVCNGCDNYVKFISKSFIPDIREIKLRIWSITQDLAYIEAAKEACLFVEELPGLDGKMMYWRLYLKLREMEAEDDKS